MKNKIISKDVVNVIQNDCNNKGDIKPLNTDDFFSIRIGSVVITKYPNEDVMLYLDYGIGKDYMCSWNVDVGRVFYDYIKHKKYNCLYEYSNDEYNVVIIKINDDDDLQKYDELPIIKIGDFDYIVIKKIGSDYSYTSKCDFADYDQDEGVVVVDDKEDDNFEDEEEPISLFD